MEGVKMKSNKIATVALLLGLTVLCNKPVMAASTSVTLSATPNPSGNYVSLNWTNSDKSQPYSYMLYSKSAHESSFQSIPAKDHVKVLNIYPDAFDTSVCPNITFKSSLDGKTYTLKSSAAIKMWMEQANSTSSSGYGKGLISVTPVAISAFNSNPNAYLKNSDGSYKYDVAFIGAWDANMNQDMNNSAETAIDTYISKGCGVLFGHDTVMTTKPYFMKLATKYLNMVVADHTVIPSYGGSEILINKKGLLTNYPWNLGNPGNALQVPLSHTWGQFAMGDNWMVYSKHTTYPATSLLTSYQGKSGANNFYLTTWNNTAMIQTGHSNGQASADEQKVLANTLFYLAQITTDTSWNDHKGQDMDAPNKPSISGVSHNTARTQYTANFSAPDNGTGYQYYVTATGQKNGAKYTSPTVSASIKTGIEGYSVVVDHSSGTVPGGSITTTSGSYTFSRPSGSDFYVHVRAVDKAGNLSSTATYHVDEKVSVTHSAATYTINPNSGTPFTATDVTLKNNSTIPVKVFLQDLTLASNSPFAINNVSPTKYADWNKLTAAQTKAEIALGFRIKETSPGSGTWASISQTGILYPTGTDKTLLGTLNPNAAGTLVLLAKHGLAWDAGYTVKQNLQLSFEVQ